MKKILVIGHRGASGYVLENSLESFKKAIKMGVDEVEFDIRRTKDGKAIVMHDAKLNRTTNGRGVIKKLTLKEIRRFRMENGEIIPTLEEVLLVLKNKIGCTIEVKDYGLEKEIVRLIKKLKVKNWVIVGSFKKTVIKKVKKLMPEARTQLIADRVFSVRHFIKKSLSLGASIIALDYKKISKKFIDVAHKNNLKVYVWTVNDRKIANKMRRLGVDGMEGNYPDRLNQI
ncbi:MAG: hypothetical protein A3I24_02480 [Candidatus Harrisonbacteria bacterium RIFCSPLOWO2_02_FULL_41_13b]|uniref:GP-PDE domain-containing protein n=1 Tax=Candidatus Harrisonbacteria bacterium RIFCSPLOWO2_02_FULL_41_13b TaxID=1798409 RepID=A0A1G1ZTR0_9BACT|nr:MAG: hypothetical protein A3J53_02465 [Candidatus Harrisonbacteria bacterium RIFCSPHIGHO2_02_FULL_40_20]OGY68113.1 MAG: hypothetical protein A3I24_02480 [Candidatus Harrisonbacteria bacterium RIFCSPLOWO2_02_FULL_41_13b]